MLLRRRCYWSSKLLLYSFFVTTDAYISSLTLHESNGSAILVIGDCHAYGKDDFEHMITLHHFFDQIKHSKTELTVVLEGNYHETARLSNKLANHLLLPTFWLYGYVNTAPHLKFKFADPRIVIHQLYKQFIGNANLMYLLEVSGAILKEYRGVIAEFELMKSLIQSIAYKSMLELMIRRIDTATKALEIFIGRNGIGASEEEQMQLYEHIIQSYLDVADMSFCLHVYRLMAVAKKIVVLVGEDHTIRINHMLEMFGYATKHIKGACMFSSLLPTPICMSDVQSYFSIFLDLCAASQAKIC